MLWNVCCSHYVHNLYRWHQFVCYKYLFFKVSVKMLDKLAVLTTLKSIVFYSVSWIEIVAFEILTNLTSIRCDVWTSKFDVPLYSDFYGLVFKYFLPYFNSSIRETSTEHSHNKKQHEHICPIMIYFIINVRSLEVEVI